MTQQIDTALDTIAPRKPPVINHLTLALACAYAAQD